MGTIIPLIIIILSFGGILTVITRKVRALAQDEGGALVYPDFDGKKELPKEHGYGKKEYPFLKIFHNIKEDGAFFIFTEKFLRRMRVRLMRIENWLGGLTTRLREKSRQKREGGGHGGGHGGGASFISLRTEEGKLDEQYWLGILKQDPQSSYPYKKLGEIYIAREDFHEARSVLKHALRLDSADKMTQAKIEDLRGKRTTKK